MLDLNTLRRDFEALKTRLQYRAQPELLDQFAAADERRRAAVTEIEELKRQRNELSAQVAQAKKAGENADEAIARSKEIGQQAKALEDAVQAADQEQSDLLARIPNLPHESVPAGPDESANQEVRRWGTPRPMDFEPQPHWDLGPKLGLLDFERAAKITGARFAVYMGAGARLERALINFMLDVHTREHGYTEVLPPFAVNSQSLFGTGQLPKFAEDLFHLEGTDYWLIPTAEVPVTNLYADETLDAEKLPLKLTAYTPCFRSEAGAYGRDTRGIIRQHQFQKVELVKFALPETSYDELEKLTADAQDILERLGLPYRTMALSSGDMGFSAAKTYDLEVWLPGLGQFKEISSCSNFEDFQARRAKIRCKAASDKKARLVHTLNGSGLAVGRTWLAVVENYQEADGGVVIPDALRPYVNAERITPAGELV
ncbi:MAG: serine--tRNA ligase [Acidobacteria bacterium]|nr:serine--tRNA ligase [Acidobacteriota bacterium]